MFFVARFAVEHLVLHEPNEPDFYSYDPQTGAWTPCTADAIKAMFSEDWQHFANEDGNPTLVPLRTNALLESLTSLLRGYAEKPEAFAHKGRVIRLRRRLRHYGRGARLAGGESRCHADHPRRNRNRRAPRPLKAVMVSSLKPPTMQSLRTPRSLPVYQEPSSFPKPSIGRLGSGYNTTNNRAVIYARFDARFSRLTLALESAYKQIALLSEMRKALPRQ